MVRLDRDLPPDLAGRAELSAANADASGGRLLVSPPPPDPNISERDFRQLVVDLARALGWMVYFTWRSDHSPAGFPDICAVRNGRILFLELKVGRGRLTVAQRAWGWALVHASAANERVAYAVLRPRDWGLLVKTLEREA
jgi:Holliday junction resolvase